MRHLKGSCYLTLDYWNAGTNSCIIAVLLILVALKKSSIR